MKVFKQLLFGVGDPAPLSSHPSLETTSHSQSGQEKEAKDYWRLYRINGQQPVPTSVRLIGDDGAELSRHPFPALVEQRARSTFELERHLDRVWEGGRKRKLGGPTPIQLSDEEKAQRLDAALIQEKEDMS